MYVNSEDEFMIEKTYDMNRTRQSPVYLLQYAFDVHAFILIQMLLDAMEATKKLTCETMLYVRAVG